MSTLRLRYIAFFFWVAGVAVVYASPFSGTYLQLTFAHGQWKSEKWEELFAHFKELGLSDLIIQWSVYEETAFFPSTDRESIDNPPLETILDLAGKADMRVRLGLAHDPQFWNKIQLEPPLVELYLNRLRKKSIDTARQLAPVISNHPAFGGWYLCEEIDDRNWLDSPSRRVLIEHLSAQVQRLKEICPTASVGISGFSSGFAEPKVFGTFWLQILESASLDLILFQDGIGAGHQNEISLPLYLKALQDVAASLKTEFQIVVEVFEMKSQGNEPFRAEPAPMARLVRQLELAEEFSINPPIAFSVPDYMTPLAGETAQKLYEDYLQMIVIKNSTLQ
jgi:hypothetical protein